MPESMAQRRLREKRRAAGLCIKCGGQRANVRFQLCEKCRKYNLEAQRKYDIRKLEARRPRCATAGTLTISQVCRLAAERGISYGQMVVEIEKGRRLK